MHMAPLYIKDIGATYSSYGCFTAVYLLRDPKGEHFVLNEIKTYPGYNFSFLTCNCFAKNIFIDL